MLLVFSKRALFFTLSLCFILSSSPRLGHPTRVTYLLDTAEAFHREPLGPLLSNLSKFSSALSSASITGPWLVEWHVAQLAWEDNPSGFACTSSRCSGMQLMSKNSRWTSSTLHASFWSLCGRAGCSSRGLSELGKHSGVTASSSRASTETKMQANVWWSSFQTCNLNYIIIALSSHCQSQFKHCKRTIIVLIIKTLKKTFSCFLVPSRKEKLKTPKRNLKTMIMKIFKGQQKISSWYFWKRLIATLETNCRKILVCYCINTVLFFKGKKKNSITT